MKEKSPNFITREELRREMRSPLEKMLDGIEPSNSPEYLEQAAYCCRELGFDAEKTVQFILTESPFELKEEDLKRLVTRVFADTSDNYAPKVTIQNTLALQVREFIERRYELRHNVVTDRVEYRERKTLHTSFRPMDTVAFNTMVQNAGEEGLKAWDKDFKRYLLSQRVLDYNPFVDYLNNLPAWDRREHIDNFFARVSGKDSRWPYFAHIWFLGMVAQWMELDAQHGNELMLVLVGEQDTHKSTFCRNILPVELREYYTENFSLDDKAKAVRMLKCFGLINFDEMDSLSESRQPVLKNFLQLKTFTTQKPYGRTIDREPRYASFIATTNQTDVLADLTGTRRFLCTSVEKVISIPKNLSYEQLYAQAVAELKAKRRYWLTKEEEAETAEMNKPFVRTPQLVERIALCFDAAKEGEKGAEWLYPTEIMQVVDATFKGKLTNKEAREFSLIMKNFIGAESHRYAAGYKYLVKRKSES